MWLRTPLPEMSSSNPSIHVQPATQVTARPLFMCAVLTAALLEGIFSFAKRRPRMYSAINILLAGLIYLRNSPGVKPTEVRNAFVKWLWSK
jgi:hypothetical protein